MALKLVGAERSLVNNRYRRHLWPQTMNDAEKKAVAIRYGEEDSAPRVLASGSGFLAERIEALAREHGVPAVKNTLLTDLLAVLEPGTPIPSDAYRLVAEILAFLYRTDLRFRENHRFMG